MAKRMLFSLAVVIAALLLGLVLSFAARGSAPAVPEEPSPAPQQPAAEPTVPEPLPAETPVDTQPQQPEPQGGYRLQSYNGRLAIFREGSDTPEMIFDGYTRLLPQADRERLEQGITAPDYETLTRLIEDYIS